MGYNCRRLRANEFSQVGRNLKLVGPFIEEEINSKEDREEDEEELN